MNSIEENIWLNKSNIKRYRKMKGVQYSMTMCILVSKLEEILSLDIFVSMCCNLVFHIVLSPTDTTEIEINEIPHSHTLIKIRARATEL